MKFTVQTWLYELVEGADHAPFAVQFDRANLNQVKHQLLAMTPELGTQVGEGLVPFEIHQNIMHFALHYC